jgi:FkbM family methyltransferase
MMKQWLRRPRFAAGVWPPAGEVYAPAAIPEGGRSVLRRIFSPRPAPARVAQAARTTYCFLGNRAVALTHSGLKIFLDVRDVGMTPHIALNGEWERQVERLLRRLLKPGAQVVEVGASMGYHTLAMAQAVGAEGHVHAFEANPRALSLLRDTITVNGFGDRVTVHADAALAEPGTVAFAVHPQHVGSGHVALAEMVAGYPERFEARGVRIDDALATLPAADLMRLDCEGTEPQALHGAEALIRRSPRSVPGHGVGRDDDGRAHRRGGLRGLAAGARPGACAGDHGGRAAAAGTRKPRRHPARRPAAVPPAAGVAAGAAVRCPAGCPVRGSTAATARSRARRRR